MIGTLIGGFLQYQSAKKQLAFQKQAHRDQLQLARENIQMQKEQREKLELQKAKYEAIEFVNPFADTENFFEDLTVNNEAFEQQKRTLEQQSANVLQQLQAASGASGVSALAQTLANNLQLQSNKMAVAKAEQMRQNEMLSAQGAQRADMLRRQGEASVQQAEISRQATLLGIDYGQLAGLNTAVQQDALNTAQSSQALAQMQGSGLSALGDMFTSLDQQGAFAGIEQGIKNSFQPSYTTPAGTKITVSG
jgi:hypothetical protein